MGYFTLTGYKLFYQDQPLQATHGPRLSETPEALAHELESKPGSKRHVKPGIATSPRPSPINGLSFGYGIATGSDVLALDQPGLDDYFAGLKELGVGWARWDIDWNNLQPDSSEVTKWSDLDRVVTTAQKFGIKSLAVLVGTPSWARPPECSQSEMCAPLDSNDFARFAGQVADRYKDKGLNHFEIWNEPNYKDFWLPAPSIDEYKDLLGPAYTAIKAVNPAAAVITGGLAAVGDEEGNIAPKSFVDGLYAKSAGSAFDAIAVHPYSYPALPSYETGWNGWQQLGPIHAAMTAAGDGAKKVWITEIGAPTGGSGEARTTADLGKFAYDSDFMTEAAQSEILADAIRLYESNGAWTGPLFWYSLRDKGGENTPENYFGLMRSDGSKKPAYATFQSALTSP
jgi:hypothetical protein